MSRKSKTTSKQISPEQAVSGSMTRSQAEAEAKRLWGALYGNAWFNPYGKEGDIDYCRLGIAVGETRDLWKPFGRGRNFETALQDAKQRGYC